MITRERRSALRCSDAEAPCFAHNAVITGTTMAVITQDATRVVAAGAASAKSGAISATSNGVATAAPAVLDAAIPAVPRPLPSMISMIISGTPVITMTARAIRIPSSPVSMMTPRLMVFPNANAKNGIRLLVAPKTIPEVRDQDYPAKPHQKGIRTPARCSGSNVACPADPRIIIVIRGRTQAR